MPIKIVELGQSTERSYEELLETCSWAMLYHSLGYRRFLKDFLPSAEDRYLLAFEGEQLFGALPTFIVDGPLGPVLNSLPFFGSHGSIVLHPEAGPSVAPALAEAMTDLCRSRGVTFATVIDTPFNRYDEIFRHAIAFQYSDQRIGQITFLPDATDCGELNEILLAMYHQKTRNIVRKAFRSELIFAHEFASEVMDALHQLHNANIVGIGGIPKPKRFFTSIQSQFEYDRDYRIYTARTSSGEIVCALMLLYFKDTVEYFVPATSENWRSAQPLSALIHLAMRDAVAERRAKKWNWGGTWLSQDGVYHFKSRWGTSDLRYHYYTRMFADVTTLRGIDRQVLLKGYPWFYTVPFSALEK